MTPPASAAKRPPGGPAAENKVTGPDGPSREARRRAAVILEVLAGIRSTAQAAVALDTSLMRYYQLETAALRGLVAGCEPKPRGRTSSAPLEVAALRRQCERLQRDLARQQALVRLAQRAVGVPAPATPPPARGKRRRKPVARALRVAAQLRAEDQPGSAAADLSAAAADG
jgi:hypothetical protein